MRMVILCLFGASEKSTTEEFEGLESSNHTEKEQFLKALLQGSRDNLGLVTSSILKLFVWGIGCLKVSIFAFWCTF